jgi:outer membrane protein assembly complex protein YaeT
MGPYLLTILFLAIPPQVVSPSFESGVQSPLEEGTATSTVNGIIGEVQFVGLKRIFSETLQGHVSSRVGNALNQRTVERDVRALANLGWFDFVSAEVVPITDSQAGDESSDLRLVFRLEERPYLSKIIFQGSELLSREHILQLLAQRKIRLKVSAPVDRVELWRASRCIKGELQALGHPQANVHVFLEEVPTATVKARFEIEDGPQVLVTQVTFSGNQAVAQRLLQHQMRQVAPKAHFAHLRHKTIYTEERLQQDLERVTEYYRNHGYAAASTGTPVVEMDYVVEQHLLLFRHQHLSPQLHISVPVNEGLFYQLGAVEVHDDLSTARRSEGANALVANSGLSPGASYSQQKIMSLRDELSLLPLPSSRANSVPSGVDVSQQLDATKGRAKAVFSIHPPNPYTLRRLDFSGERRFSDRYYRRRIPLREGDPFDPDKLRSGLERLSRTGYLRSFKPEDIRMQFNDVNHSVDVFIRVTEVGQQKISLTGGWNSLGGTIGTAYSVFNLLGGQELIDSHIDVGPDSLHLALRIAEESLFGSRVTASLTVFQDVVRPHLPGVLGNRHFLSTRNAGFAVGWGYPLSLNETLTTNYTISHQTTQYAVELPPSLTGLVGNQIGSSTSIHSFGADWVGGNSSQHWDIGSSVSGGRLGGDENFVRSSVEYDRVRSDPLTNGRNSWALRSYAAGVSSFRGDLLFQNRYFTGDELLRGFRRGEMSPYSVEDLTDSSGKNSFQSIPTGADLLVGMNAEYRVPVAPRTQVVGFYDTGSSWLLPNWLGPDRPTLLSGTNGILRASTGLELRWQIPAVEQPLRLDLAINPLRLARLFLLADGSHFRAPDRLLGWTWGLGPLF